MPQLYGASPEAADAFASVPDGPGVNDPAFREILNRVELALQMVRGGAGAPETFEVVPGGTASSYSVKVGPYRLAPLVGTAGAKLLEATSETTLTQPTLAALTGVLDAWRYVVATISGGAVAWSLTSTAPAAHGWSSNRQTCYVGAIRTDGSGNPLAVVRTGRSYLYSRWYADAAIVGGDAGVTDITQSGAGTATVSLATRVPPGAKTVRLHCSAKTGTAGVGEASDSSYFALAAGDVVELPLNASQEIKFTAAGGGASATLRVVGWGF